MKPQSISQSSIDSIKILHARLIRANLHEHPKSIAPVLSSYALSPPLLTKSLCVFNHVPNPPNFIFNPIIRALSLSNHPKDSIFFYDQIRSQVFKLSPNHLTIIYLLKACSRSPSLRLGQIVHSHLLSLGFGSHSFVSNALIHMYSFCGSLNCGRKVFDEMPERDVVSWNSLICGYAQGNEYREVIRLFKAMRVENVKADEVTMVKVVLACMHLREWELADSMIRYIEDNCLEVDVYLGNTLIDFYGRLGDVESARKVFDEMTERNIVSWNAMIMGHAKAGNLVSAKKLFDEMPERDVISWTSIITGYSQTNQFTEALSIFHEMMVAEVKPDEITVASVLSACAHLGALDVGKKVHGYIHEKNVRQDLHVGNALIDMYSKGGSTEMAFKVFGEMKDRDTISWTSLISGMAVNGNADGAMKLFSQMLSEGVRPSSVAFLGALVACSHRGLVGKGLEYFNSMSEVYRIEPEMKHYGCVVDLLSRAGLLREAHEFIMKMPINPDPIVWRMLLSACKVYGNVNLAEIAIHKLLELDPTNSGNYVLLSNTYAEAERWDDAKKVREMMEDSYVRKAAGYSSVENGIVN